MTATTELAPQVPSQLDIGVQRLVGLVELSLDGTLEGLGVDALCRVLEQLLVEGATAVDVDCTELAGVDGFGLALLLDAHRQLGARGGFLVLRYPSPAVLEQVRRARLLDVLVAA